jgi:hypothetical protein
MVYDLRTVLKYLLERFCRDFCTGSDAAELGEILRHRFLEVWVGDETPYILTETADFEAELGRELGTFFC